MKFANVSEFVAYWSKHGAVHFTTRGKPFTQMDAWTEDYKKKLGTFKRKPSEYKKNPRRAYVSGKKVRLKPAGSLTGGHRARLSKGQDSRNVKRALRKAGFRVNPRKRPTRTQKRYEKFFRASKAINQYNAARQAENEAYLRTPKGEQERQARNAATVARMRKNPRDRTDKEWVDECNYISRVCDKGGKVKEMNYDPATFIRYCEMQKADAERHGRDDTATYIKHCIDDMQKYKKNPRKKWTAGGISGRRYPKKKPPARALYLQEKRGAMWHTVATISNASESAARTVATKYQSRHPTRAIRLIRR